MSIANISRSFAPNRNFLDAKLSLDALAKPCNLWNGGGGDQKLTLRCDVATRVSQQGAERSVEDFSPHDFDRAFVDAQDRARCKTQELALARGRSNAILMPPRSEQAHCVRCKARTETTSLILEHGSSMPRILSQVVLSALIPRTCVPTHRPPGRVLPTGRKPRTSLLRVRRVAPID